MGRTITANTNSKRKIEAGGFVQYLTSPSEPKEVVHAGKGMLTFRGRHVMRRQMVLALRRLRGARSVL